MVASLHGGIDAGGTSFKCGVADESGHLVDTRRVPVTTPDETLKRCAAFFCAQGPLESFGIASFGPVDVDPDSPGYGTILESPKAGWAGINLRAHFEEALGVAVRLDTDVNGALLAEIQRGAAKDAASAAYVTIGTGIGAGVFANDALVGKPRHPEFGHIPVRRAPGDEATRSVCPFHSDCLEGLASASAMTARYGDPAQLPEDHPGWDAQADYLAQACRVLSLAFRLERIVLGGGLMQAGHLLARVRAAYTAQMAGYADASKEAADALIVCAGLGDDAGLHGAILLGRGAS